uniref:Uncharacterized protein n=1 Tax=Lutzomyia longipalpis TaxID=7200 RepID=A0A7G3B4T4_LUTLO
MSASRSVIKSPIPLISHSWSSYSKLVSFDSVAIKFDFDASLCTFPNTPLFSLLSPLLLNDLLLLLLLLLLLKRFFASQVTTLLEATCNDFFD